MKVRSVKMSSFDLKVPDNPSRIFFDASHSIASGKNSGIERVVRKVMAEWTKQSKEGSLSIQPVLHSGEVFYGIDDRLRTRFERIASFETNAIAQLPKWMSRSLTKLCELFPHKKFRKWFLPSPGHLGAFKLLHSCSDSLLRRSLAWSSEVELPGEGDLLFLPDAYWTQRGIWAAVEAARARGAFVATLIYDLIPLTHPQFVGNKRSEGFELYLRQAIENSNLLVAISATVKNELNDYIETHRTSFRQVPSHLSHFTLGAELSHCKGIVRPEVCEVFPEISTETGTQTQIEYQPNTSCKRPYLMVSTFDPRKNHHYLLDAFDLLWDASGDQSLCLVGRVGSLCDDVIQRVRSHSQYNRLLFAFHDLNDTELEHCYRNSSGVIFPSITEGFGLPIVEALWHRSKVFASDTPIHREVGASDCEYFDLGDPRSLAKQIKEYESPSNTKRQRAAVRIPTTWKESSHQLMELCLSAYRDTRNRNALSKAA